MRSVTVVLPHNSVEQLFYNEFRKSVLIGKRSHYLICKLADLSNTGKYDKFDIKTNALQYLLKILSVMQRFCILKIYSLDMSICYSFCKNNYKKNCKKNFYNFKLLMFNPVYSGNFRQHSGHLCYGNAGGNLELWCMLK